MKKTKKIKRIKKPDSRYRNVIVCLDEAVDRYLPAKFDRVFTILEVGVFAGQRSEEMIKHCLEVRKLPAVSFAGFDLFEDMTPDRNIAEFGKPRLAPRMEKVRARLISNRVLVSLFRGDTLETLPVAKSLFRGVVDFVFLDGGHSLETIASDWSHVKEMLAPGGICLFDDYYDDRNDVGCKHLIDSLKDDPVWDAKALDPIDRVEKAKLDIRTARVSRRS